MPKHLNSAARQYLGYSLQLSRLLAHLLDGEDSRSVSLETLGDVVVERDATPARLEELKSYAPGNNPIADRSVELWKTLRNWIALIEKGLVRPEATEFCLHTTRSFPSKFAQRFAAVSGRKEAEQAIADVLSSFTATPATGTLGRHVRTVLAEENRASLVALLRAFRLSEGSGTSESELFGLLRRTVVPEEHVQEVLHFLLGWVKRVTDSQIEAGQAAVISVSDFRRELTSIVRKLDTRLMLNSFAFPPTSEQLNEERQSRTFVRQLEIIREEDDAQIRAVRDYLRARSDRIEWSRRALVHSTDFDTLEEELEGAWSSEATIVAVRDGERSEEDRGRLVYHECLQHRCKVRGMETPSHFAAGSFHALADGLTIGWHPRYKELLEIPPTAEES